WHRTVDVTTTAEVYLSGSAFSSDGQFLLVGYASRGAGSRSADYLRRYYRAANSIVLWDMAAGKEVRQFKPRTPLDPINVVAFSPDGKRALSGTGHVGLNHSSSGIEASVRLWDVATGQELTALPNQQWDPYRGKVPLRVSCAAFS